MKTPYGKECSFFYGDYYRGRDREECRLLGTSWFKDLCRTCPVPSIERANACENLQLRSKVDRPLISAFQRRVKITSYCMKTNLSGFDPHVGCGECHPLGPLFQDEKELK